MAPGQFHAKASRLPGEVGDAGERRVRLDDDRRGDPLEELAVRFFGDKGLAELAALERSGNLEGNAAGKIDAAPRRKDQRQITGKAVLHLS